MGRLGSGSASLKRAQIHRGALAIIVSRAIGHVEYFIGDHRPDGCVFGRMDPFDAIAWVAMDGRVGSCPGGSSVRFASLLTGDAPVAFPKRSSWSRSDRARKGIQWVGIDGGRSHPGDGTRDFGGRGHPTADAQVISGRWTIFLGAISSANVDGALLARWKPKGVDHCLSAARAPTTLWFCTLFIGSNAGKCDTD